MSKRREMQRVIRAYKDETGEREVDMHKVAKWAISKGWPLPKPASPLDLLAKEFTGAAREEIKYDKETGSPYRVYHSITVKQGETQLHLFIDIDEAPRSQILKSLISRREQMVGDGLQLTFDMEHWNRVNSKEAPIEIPMDLTPDIEWRKNAPPEEEEAA
jgi:hypothetical protein